MKVRIIGSGAMGQGIAQVFATAGHQVQLCDVSTEIVSAAKAKLAAQLTKLVSKERLSEADKSAVLERIEVTDGASDASDIELLLEAVSEAPELKKEIFRSYDGRCGDSCLFATNTSSISITELSAGLQHAERFAGMHFFNPPPVMKLIEVIAGVQTSAETIEAIRQLSEQLGKTPVLCRESPGFIVNRLLIPMLNEACDLLEQQVATKEAIDQAMQLGANHPMGPLALADLVGLDVCLSIMETLQAETGDPKYRPSILLRRMVRSGRLGRKTGRGFYEYA